MSRCKQKQRGLRGLLCRWPSITEWEMYITAQGPPSRNDLYCVEWDVKPYYTIPYTDFYHSSCSSSCAARAHYLLFMDCYRFRAKMIYYMCYMIFVVFSLLNTTRPTFNKKCAIGCGYTLWFKKTRQLWRTITTTQFSRF